MKNLLSLIIFCCGAATLFAQTAQIDTGLIGGAAYEIQIPANWNKKLVMYAHGYESPETPLRRMLQNPVLQVFLDKGFATARSSYSQTGWALPEGVDDTEMLRRYFIKKHGNPDSVFMTGHSMGGGITLATIEKYGNNYAGGLALCPLSTRAYDQVKGAFDGYVVFNALFGSPLPPLGDLLSKKTPSVFAGNFDEKLKKAVEIVKKIQEKQPDALAQFAENRRLKLQDLPFSLIFGEGVLLDMASQSGGNPFDNTNTYYENYDNAWELNQKVERLAASAPNLRLTTYDRSGILDKPVVLLHTTYDQLITPNNGLNNYDALVHTKRKEHNLKMFFTNGQGHCAFSPEQTATAFDALRSWAKTGQKPSGVAIASPSVPAPKDELCYELRVYTAEKGKLNDLLKRFRNYTVQKFEACGMTNVGYWTPIDNPDEKLYYVLSYPNRAVRESAWKQFMDDTTRQRIFKESEANGKLINKIESVFLKTTDFSPNNFQNKANSGVWEFRIYHATPNNLGLLQSRFRDFTVKRFQQYGMNNKVYWTATDAAQGADKMLYYFLTHPSEAAAKEAFAKFRIDPEWIATRKASEVKGGGPLTTKVESIFMYPTDFSKLK